MHTFRFTAVIIGIAFLGLGSTKAVANDASIESFVALSKQLENAVGSRDFHEAREIVDKLLPLMKADIKVSKKILSGLKKEEQPVIPVEEYDKKYNRKIELYDSVKHLIELSPAALRGKSDLIVEEVDEFIKLMESDPSDA